jgi:hypothetical protein
VIGQTTDDCLYGGFNKKDAIEVIRHAYDTPDYDHESQIWACESLGYLVKAFSGPSSALRRCYYGKDSFEYCMDYTQ